MAHIYDEAYDIAHELLQSLGKHPPGVQLCALALALAAAADAADVSRADIGQLLLALSSAEVNSCRGSH